MAFPTLGGGYQVTDGNVNELQIVIQSTPTTITTGSGTLTAATLTSALFRARKTGDGAWTLYRLC